MAPDPTARPVRPGLSLYANLLDPSTSQDSTPATISRAPVVFKQPAEGTTSQDRVGAEKQQINSGRYEPAQASLRFQPTKRPQLSAQKLKPKTASQRVPAVVAPSTSQPDALPSESANLTARLPAKTTLADWTAEGEENDVNGFYGGEKRQRGGRKKRRKNKEMQHISQNWDDIYDPSRPNNYEDYKHSDENIMEIREWKDKLYAHRMAQRNDSDSDSSSRDYKPQLSRQHAPAGLSFAPPPSLEDGDQLKRNSEKINVPDIPTGEDAFPQRLRLSHEGDPPELSSQVPNIRGSDMPFPPPPSAPETTNIAQRHPSIGTNTVPPPLLPTITRAPVRYKFPDPPSEIPASEAELVDALQSESRDQKEEHGEEQADNTSRSLRPGQKGFAERLMSKYGWSKGSGLGATGTGIVNPLRVQVEKQSKKPDSEGGGFVVPGGRGKIVGGKKKGGPVAESDEGKFGAMSEVVVLRGMVAGMDLDAEMEGTEGGIMQEIGDECGEKYGRVERVFIDRSEPSKAPVFVKFTSQLSALRAVNALEGRIFNGNTISARFFNKDKFETGNYE